jgi:shikimate 5-dehydrogenase
VNAAVHRMARGVGPLRASTKRLRVSPAANGTVPEVLHCRLASAIEQASAVLTPFLRTVKAYPAVPSAAGPSRVTKRPVTVPATGIVCSTTDSCSLTAELNGAVNTVVFGR